MEELLKLNLFHLNEYCIKLLVLIWNLTKCSILFLVFWKLSKFFCIKITKLIEKNIENVERKQQILTLKTIVQHALNGFIVTIYGINMLYLFGIDIKPILATAGVLGVAVGFGSKKSVEDVMSGLTIILEGQVRVGDYVDIEGYKGFVEKITLPLITIRAFETGALCYIRCGYIDKIINYTMNYSYAFFAFDVGYEQNVDKVNNAIKTSFEKLKEVEEYKNLIIGEIELFGLDEFKESSLCIKCRIKTQPKGQWTIKRAFNKIIKEQFDLEDIEIPFNQIVVTSKK